MPKGKLKQWNDRSSAVALTDADGSELQRVDPEKYQAVVRAINEGMPSNLIERIFKVSSHTVKGITISEGIDTLRLQSLVMKCKMAAHLSWDIYLEKLANGAKDLDLNRLPVNGAIAIDKVRELEGRMQAQSSQVKQEQTLEALNDIVKEAIKKTETKGQVIDIEPVPEKDSQT